MVCGTCVRLDKGMKKLPIKKVILCSLLWGPGQLKSRFMLAFIGPWTTYNPYTSTTTSSLNNSKTRSRSPCQKQSVPSTSNLTKAQVLSTHTLLNFNLFSKSPSKKPSLLHISKSPHIQISKYPHLPHFYFSHIKVYRIVLVLAIFQCQVNHKSFVFFLVFFGLVTRPLGFLLCYFIIFYIEFISFFLPVMVTIFIIPL